MSLFGIDLGTTYSCIAKYDEASMQPVVIRNIMDESDTTPSVVFFESAGNSVVGQPAKDRILTDGDRVVQFVKRRMGQEVGADYTFFDHAYTPIDISSLILKKLKAYAEASTGEEVKDVVITCPAYFSLGQHSATKQAGILAGFNVLQVVNEPTAAALSYCHETFAEETFLVYDLGGGTFDVSIIKTSFDEAGKKHFAAIAVDGNHELGGKDWDDDFFAYICTRVASELNIPEDSISTETFNQIRSKIESTKKILSNLPKTNLRFTDNGEAKTLLVTREEFETVTASQLNKTFAYVDAILKKSGMTANDIDTVLLVGGSSLMNAVREGMEERFPDKVKQRDPHLAVAKGAAIYARIMSDIIEEPVPGPHSNEIIEPPIPPINIPDEVLASSFGVKVYDRERNRCYIDQLLLRDSVMISGEMTKEKRYGTVADNAPVIALYAYETRSTEARIDPEWLDESETEANPDTEDLIKFVGMLELHIEPNMPAGTPIRVLLRARTDGLYIEAENETTGTKENKVFQFKGTYSEEELHKRADAIADMDVG